MFLETEGKAGDMAPPPGWLVSVQMSERMEWRIMPWQLPDIPTWWAERLLMYFAARAQVDPVLQRKHALQGAG